MKTPPLLLGAALIFWGWQTGWWILASLMAIVFEGSHLIRLRWHLSARDFRRISDLSAILLVILLVYLYFSDTSAYFLYVVLRWLPLVCFPLLAAQAYAAGDRINLSALFLLRRKNQKKRRKKRGPTLNLTYPYLAICILSASAANVRDVYFYTGLFGLSALSFWFVRSQRFSVLMWICLMALAGGAGFIGHIGLHGLHLTLEQKGLEWFSNSNRQNSDPFQTNTALGDIGRLKPSNRIVFRVKPDGPNTSPTLLREAVYDRYGFSWWFASDSAFTPVRTEKDRKTWNLGPGRADPHAIIVSAYLHDGQGVLKLPGGVFQIGQLPVAGMEKNRLGTVKVAGGPGLVTYRVLLDQALAVDSAPSPSDLQIPAQEKSAIDEIISQLDLEGKSPRMILKIIETFFQKKFSYSLVLTGKGHHPTPLSTFLLQTRSGHCEYFATATVLLLRAAGIPSRYVKGYSVHEFSRLENRFIVRERDAHAWTLAHLDGAWYNFDTTPPSWASREDAAATGWGLIADLWSYCIFQLTAWLERLRNVGKLKYLLWVIIPLICLPVGRIYFKKKAQPLESGKSPQTCARTLPAGSDSEFYLIEKALNKLGFGRHASETFRNWGRRLQEKETDFDWMTDLRPLLDLHYRYRFDPKGINTTERAALKSGTQVWLDKYNKFTDDKTVKV